MCNSMKYSVYVYRYYVCMCIDIYIYTVEEKHGSLAAQSRVVQYVLEAVSVPH